MTRPLKGTIKANQNGTFTASVPARIGSSRRRTATFDSKAAAVRWRDDAIRILADGGEVPAHRPAATSSSGGEAGGTAFITIATAYITERYVEDGHGDIDREEQVTSYAKAIDDYLVHAGLTLEALTRGDVRRMWQHMLKAADAPPAEPVIKAANYADDLVTKNEALQLLADHGHPVSESTFKRAIWAGAIAPVDTTGRAHLFRVVDVLSAQAGLVRSTSRPEEAPSAGRYAHSTLVDVRRTFRAVVSYAAAEGIKVSKRIRGAELPRDRGHRARVRALTLEEASRIASRLHVVHQLVLWLLMLLGLRLSEPFGLLVEDVIDNGPGEPGLVVVQSQGGRKFRRRKGDKTIEVTDHVDHTKGKRSERILVVPPTLMDLIRLVIDVFHTDVDGTVRRDSRLVPGLVSANKSGQSSFRNAMTRAGAAEAVDITFELKLRADRAVEKVTPTPQRLRQSYASAHHADMVPIEDIRATLGQRLGPTVLHTNYLLDELGLKASRRIAEATQAQLDDQLAGVIMTPTTVRCTTKRQPALVAQAAEIDAALSDAGWLVDGMPEGDWVTVNDAAGYLGVSHHHVRDNLRTGKLDGIAAPRPDQAGTRHLVAADSMIAYPPPRTSSDMVELANELGLAYDVVRMFVARHPGLALERAEGRRDGTLSDYAIAYVREYFEEQQDLAERAVRITDVAIEMGVSVAAVNTLIARGELVEDVRFHGGFRSVTTESLASMRARRARGPGGRRR